MTAQTIKDYIVERYSGRSFDGWKIRFRGSDVKAWEKYYSIAQKLRQGKVRLINPEGTILASTGAPRLRTRW